MLEESQFGKGKKEGHLSHEEIAEKLQNFDID